MFALKQKYICSEQAGEAGFARNFTSFKSMLYFADLKPFHRLAFEKRASTLETSRCFDLVPA